MIGLDYMTGLLKDKGVDIRRFFYYLCSGFAGSVARFFGYTDEDRVFSLVSIVQGLGILKGVCRNNPVVMVACTYHNGRIIDACFYVMEGRVGIKIFEHLLTVLAASVFIDPSPASGSGACPRLQPEGLQRQKDRGVGLLRLLLKGLRLSLLELQVSWLKYICVLSNILLLQ